MSIYEDVRNACESGNIIQIRIWADKGFDGVTGRVYRVPFGPHKPKTWREFQVEEDEPEAFEKKLFAAIKKNIDFLMRQ